MILAHVWRRTLRVAGCATVLLGAATVGCEKKDDDKTDASAEPASSPAAANPPPATPPPAAPPPAAPAPAPAGAVTRYPDEKPLQGGETIDNDVPARKDASAQSEVVQNLARGSGVARVAQHEGWTLVSWKQTTGDKMGWVESARAFGNRWREDNWRVNRAIDEGRRRGLLRR